MELPRLQSGELFYKDAKVIEFLNREESGNYCIERYKILDIFCGVCSAYVFFVDGKEYHREMRVGLLHKLIEWHIKHEILNLYPLRDATSITL